MELIVNERLRLSSIDAKMNTERFADLHRAVGRFEEKIKNEQLRNIFHKCFFNTIETTTFFEPDGSCFVITGDIPAMWLRDSSVQVMHYLHFAKECASVQTLIKGVLKRQWNYILIDPYANAFNREANGNGHAFDLDKQSPWVWERKFELDSLCYPLWLAIKYYRHTNDTSCFDDLFLQAFDKIMQTFQKEQNHFEKTTYYHKIPMAHNRHWCGKGTPHKVNGMVWSGYRPSDDKCKYAYYIPGNMFIVSVLVPMEKIFRALQDTCRADACKEMYTQVQAGLDSCAIVESNGKRIYAFETDGLGNYNLMDDANCPNLLAMPYYEYPFINKEVYKNTRSLLLSKNNPFYYEGSILTGIGSPHTPKDHVWPMSLVMQALTSDDQEEINRCIEMVVASTGGTGYMHESVHKDDDKKYSRPWFAWANSLFAYCILEKCDDITIFNK